LFYGFNSISEVVLGNQVETIGENAFTGCKGITHLTFGKATTNIEARAFAGIDKLEDVVCFAKNVPETDRTAFEGSYIDYATLHVPAIALEEYKATKPWSQFGKIVPLTDEELDISTPNVAKEVEPKDWFTLDGRRIDKPQKGLNIVVMQDGTVKKTVVKDKR
jgi:hypothetical protein